MMGRQQSRDRAQANAHTHPLIEGFALSDKDSVSFDKVRIECLREREDDVPGVEHSY